MKKRLIWILTAVVLVAAVLVGGTWAYTTETVESINVVTVGKVKIKAETERLPDVTVTPGVSFPIRYIKITNTGGADAYVRVRVEPTNAAMKDKFELSLSSAMTDWKEWTNTSTGVTYYLSKSILPTGASRHFLADAMPSVIITQADIDNYAGTINGIKVADFNVTVEAIQSDHITLDSMSYPQWPDVEIKPAK